MAMGKRKDRQESLFIATDQIMPATGHPFYQKLNALLEEFAFDRWAEQRCAEYYEQKEKRGQPSIPPGVYVRMMLVGYFEGIDSQRGIAWRCGDSLSVRQFLGIPLDEGTPTHPTLTNTRKRLWACPIRDPWPGSGYPGARPRVARQTSCRCGRCPTAPHRRSA